MITLNSFLPVQFLYFTLPSTCMGYKSTDQTNLHVVCCETETCNSIQVYYYQWLIHYACIVVKNPIFKTPTQNRHT